MEIRGPLIGLLSEKERFYWLSRLSVKSSCCSWPRPLGGDQITTHLRKRPAASCRQIALMAGFRFPSAIFCNLLSTRWLQPRRGEWDVILVNTGVVMVNNGWGKNGGRFLLLCRLNLWSQITVICAERIRSARRVCNKIPLLNCAIPWGMCTCIFRCWTLHPYACCTLYYIVLHTLQKYYRMHVYVHKLTTGSTT